MSQLAQMSADTVLNLHGQDCRLVFKNGRDAEITRCIAKPSLDQSSGDRISADKYDVSVLEQYKLKTGDEVALLDDDGEIEMTIVISKPFVLLAAMRVFVGQVL